MFKSLKEIIWGLETFCPLSWPIDGIRKRKKIPLSYFSGTINGYEKEREEQVKEISAIDQAQWYGGGRIVVLGTREFIVKLSTSWYV